MIRCTPGSTLFPYTTLFRSSAEGISSGRFFPSLTLQASASLDHDAAVSLLEDFSTALLFDLDVEYGVALGLLISRAIRRRMLRSEEHTSELQSRENLVCRLL